MYKVTPKIVDDLVKAIDQGLSYGLGLPEPGKMCVEAAICYIHGWDHNDRPSCVDLTLRSISIHLNDHYPVVSGNIHKARREVV